RGPGDVRSERLGQYPSGQSPFLSDRVELNNEGRPRAELKGRGWDLTWVGRFSESQASLYDNIFSISKRMDCIQPRLSYETRLGLVTFDVRLLGLDPGFNEPPRPRGTPRPAGDDEGRLPGMMGRRGRR